MIKGFLRSKKFIVFLTTTVVSAAVMFGVPEEHAIEFVETLSQLAMAYMGGQGLADAGKYAGEAIATMKERNAELARHNGLPSEVDTEDTAPVEEGKDG